ncbi:DUF1559 domain-containing protein [Aeoliella sp.]|uniref:DUF1559 family PulG-like putative transporter n=1 Tax=Aeoliella sp. TaxID=2795800 RepID=UPI003CCB9DF5
MTFRLATLLYAFALFSAALAVLGTWGGCLATAGVLLLWASFRSSDIVVGCGVFVLAWVLLVAGLLSPAVLVARGLAQANSCIGGLTHLAMSLLNYESLNGTLPPAVGSLGTSGDTQSWRVLVLPLLQRPTVYNAYNMNEPWNGPTNSKLSSDWIYACPTHGSEEFTSYLAVVGPQCAWNHGGPPRKLSDITDDHSETITIIDVGRSDINWKEPRDLSFDEAVELLIAPVDPQTFTGHVDVRGVFLKPSYYYNVAMVDRSVHRLRVPLERSTAEALLTINGGEKLDEQLFDKIGKGEIRYELVYGWILFAVLAVIPAVPTWRWFRRSRLNTESNDQVEH